ncbi:hypothetical protein [Nocardia australiensis]|uniref:hypothetical protein n=1 Tax=Nocardia australiensis TaxID=2887191 RepID=UPI001D132D84|nr:hypothetical protein [Nocardia australiensis]
MKTYRSHPVRCTERAGGSGASTHQENHVMKRTSTVALAVGAAALLLTGCGGSDESTDANDLREGNTGASTSAAPTTPANTGGGGNGGAVSQTTCAQWQALDSNAQMTLINQILAENPDSPFAGSPNVALGTAKLVCLAPNNADKTVVEAAGITEQVK